MKYLSILGAILILIGTFWECCIILSMKYQEGYNQGRSEAIQATADLCDPGLPNNPSTK